MRMKVVQDDEPGHRYPPPLISPMKKEDTHPIAVFAYEAVASSPLHAYFNPLPSDWAKSIKSFEDQLIACLDDPNFMLMKAVDTETGEVAAYAVWERVARQSGEEQKLCNREQRASIPLQLMLLTSENELRKEKGVSTFVGAERFKFMNSWAKDTKYIELQGIATAVRFQRRGYASALVKWGHEKADAEGQVSFLLASPVGRYLYVSLGWKEIGRIVIDMKEWVEGAERGDLGWGTWMMYHMIRLPKTAA